jgi:hypothetical protein
LLGSAIRGRVDESVIGRIIAETQGNFQTLLDVLTEFLGAVRRRLRPEHHSRVSRGLMERVIDRVQHFPSTAAACCSSQLPISPEIRRCLACRRGARDPS